MIKVLAIITTEFVSYGGLTTVMMNYYRAMDKTEIQIDFASTNEAPADLKKELDQNNSKYYYLGKRNHVFRYFFNLRGLLKKERYDVVHIHGNSATTVLELLPAYFQGVPKRIIHIHNSACSHKCLNACLLPIFRRLYTDAAACSQKAGEWIFKSSFVLLPNAIDLKKYAYNTQSRKTVRSKFSTSDKVVVIGNVGKMESEQKNHPFMIECFARLCSNTDNYELWLIGDGENKTTYEQIAEQFEVAEKVKFLGIRSDVPEILSAMDVFFFPSLWEGLPLSVLEAQSAGLPCLLSDNITEEVVVTSLVKQMGLDEDKECWCEALKTMRSGDRNNVSCNARIRLEEEGFDITKSCQILTKMYLS